MIPDRLIDQAAAAIYAATVFGDEFAYDAWHDMDDDNPIKTATRLYARAALEAVAADIWDDAIDDTAGQGTIQIPPNPYRASENE